MLPTTPVNRHVLPALFVHVAVAVEPTARQVMERLLTSASDAEGAATASKGRRPRIR